MLIAPARSTLGTPRSGPRSSTARCRRTARRPGRPRPSRRAAPAPRRRWWRRARRACSRCSPPSGRSAAAVRAPPGAAASGPRPCPWVSPRSHCSVGLSRKTRVSGPGQNSSIRSWPNGAQRLRQRRRRAHAADQHRGRHVPAAPLGRQQRGDRLRGERVRAEPVHRVGGQDDKPTRLDRGCRREIPASRCCASAQSYRALMVYILSRTSRFSMRGPRTTTAIAAGARSDSATRPATLP